MYSKSSKKTLESVSSHLSIPIPQSWQCVLSRFQSLFRLGFPKSSASQSQRLQCHDPPHRHLHSTTQHSIKAHISPSPLIALDFLLLSPTPSTPMHAISMPLHERQRMTRGPGSRTHHPKHQSAKLLRAYHSSRGVLKIMNSLPRMEAPGTSTLDHNNHSSLQSAKWDVRTLFLRRHWPERRQGGCSYSLGRRKLV